ncbi:MAG: hypothetical protein BIFFINMI_02729 [Phycisphaerae bacterium]|nr:hypothetical protein [Phycisphaerae bacterium]
MKHDILIGTVLLERNRWLRGQPRTPTFRVSEWAGRLAADGFDGMELWENHARLAGDAEVAALAGGPLPVAVFNSYAEMTDAGAADRAAAGELARRLGARGIKFNVGGDAARWDEYLANVRAWRRELPSGITLLCECHPGTVIETPAAARRFFDALDAEEEAGNPHPAPLPGREREGWEIIVHPFSRFESLADWFELFGPKVTHAHLQMVAEGNARVRMDQNAALAGEALGLMKCCGYAGSFALEFTGGMSEGERIETMHANALSDLRTLRSLLA